MGYDKVKANQDTKDAILAKGHYDLKGAPLKLTKGAGGKDIKVRSSKDMVESEKRKEKAGVCVKKIINMVAESCVVYPCRSSTHHAAGLVLSLACQHACD